MHFSVLPRAIGVASLLASSVVGQTPPSNYNELTLYWDYGHSPPVYPTPQGKGTGDWATAYAQAKGIVAQMTNEEKQNITFGHSAANGCSGNSPGVPRLGYAGMCLNDAGNGLRGTEGVSGYPAGVHAGASWNRALLNARAYYMGMEFKAKGVNMILGPVVGPLGRLALGGRNWEGFTNDPYLAGELVYQTINGLQESVIACVKHYIGNEQETNRNPSGLNASVSSNIDDKTLHEVYLWPFQDAVRAESGAVMCSYNRVNNSYACANSKTMNGILKTELGFQGLVVSANSGLDMAMPNSPYWQNLSMAVSNGSVAQSRLNDMATRIIATWYKYAPFENPGFGIAVSTSTPHKFVNARVPASASTIYQGAVEGHVLVKNTHNTLPLKPLGFISLFGYDAMAPPTNNPTIPNWDFSLQSVNGSAANPYAIFYGALDPEAAYLGNMWVGGGSGGNTPPYVDAPFNAFSARAKADGTWLAWDFLNQNPVVDQASEACVVFVNEFSTEGEDRPGLADPYSDALITNVASQCSNTIVVIHNAGIRIVDAFYDNPNVTAIIYAHLPGQDSGTALVDLMYGVQGFSGRLPYTVAKQASDYGSLLAPVVPDATSDYFTQSNFTEGDYIDYKSFIQRGITPRFAFGYGMTYSNFRYSNIGLSMASGANLTALPPNAAILSGGNPHLFDTIATVTITIANVGRVAAAEVPQLYVGIPHSPPKQLRGFAKEIINPGMSVVVSFPLTRRDLSVWDVVQQNWVLQSGTYHFKVGKNVLDIQASTNTMMTTS